MTEAPLPADDAGSNTREQAHAVSRLDIIRNNRKWLRAVAPVAFIALCAEMGTSVLNNSTLPVYYTLGLHIRPHIYTLLMIPFFISEVLFKAPLGVLADKIGRKPLMLCGCLITVFTPLVLMSIHYEAGTDLVIAALFAFGFLRLLDGLGGAAIWPALFAYIGDEVPEDKRGSAMGLLNVMYMAGLAVSFYLGGRLDDNFDKVLTGENSLSGEIHRIGHNMHAFVRHMSDRMHHLHGGDSIPGFNADRLTEAMSRPDHYFPSMYLASFLFVLASLACLVGLRKRAGGERHVQGETVTWASFVKALVNIPEYLVLAFITFFGTGCIAPIFKIFAVSDFHMTEERIGVLMLIITGIIALLAYPLGHLSDKWGKPLCVKLGFIVCSIGLWGIPMLHRMHHVHAVAFVLSASLIGIGSAVAFPAWNALLTSLTDESHRGTVFGAVSTAQGIGVLLGYLTSGFLYERGHIVPFATSAVFVTASAVISLLFVKEKRGQISI